VAHQPTVFTDGPAGGRFGSDLSGFGGQVLERGGEVQVHGGAHAIGRVAAMRAVVLTSYGDPDVLTIAEIAEPEIGPEDVLVEVTATALNRADLLQRRGLYPEPVPRLTHEVPGMELSGRVAAVGALVSGWQVGAQVMAIVGGGAYAEKVAVHERQLMAVPRGVSLADAAALPEVGITAHDALVTQGGLRSGGWALVHAGASGVGSMAVQIARAVGARVIATTSAAKLDAVRSLGADAVVDYRSGDFVAVAAEVTEGRGVDVVLDVVGGDYLSGNVSALTRGGTIVQVGVMGGGRTPIDLGTMLAKRARLVGTVLRSRPLEEKVMASRRFADEIVPAIEAGVIRPVIDRRFRLDQISQAHRYLETNTSVGKVLIDL
jgi:putative PIG3 family NAD(P)H quinone oxidoreductase